MERIFAYLRGDDAVGPIAGADGDLHALPIPEALRPFIHHVLMYRESFGADDHVVERVIPDGFVRLLFNLGDAPSVGAVASAGAEALGATVKPAIVRLGGSMVGYSIALRPGVASALLGVGASEIAHGAVSLDEVWGERGQRWLERVADHDTDADRTRAIFELLLERVAQCQPIDPRIVRLANGLAQEGALSVRDAAARLGVGERRLQQVFRDHVGLGARAFGRLARFRRCLRSLESATAGPWAAFAIDHGFFDQAHLVREFRALSGLTPGAFLRARVSGSYNTKRAPVAIPPAVSTKENSDA